MSVVRDGLTELYAWVCTLPGGAEFIPHVGCSWHGQPAVSPLFASDRASAEGQRRFAVQTAEACRAALRLVRFAGPPELLESYPAATVPAPETRQ